MHIHPNCTCAYPGKIDSTQYNTYSLIVKGKVLSQKIKGNKFSGTRIIELSVDKVYKGVSVKSTVIVVTPDRESMCGILPKIGESWLVFATKFKGNFETDLCTRTKSMNPKAWDYNKEILEEDLQFLEDKIKQNSN